jgi:hypothetical protein
MSVTSRTYLMSGVVILIPFIGVILLLYTCVYNNSSGKQRIDGCGTSAPQRLASKYILLLQPHFVLAESLPNINLNDAVRLSDEITIGAVHTYIFIYTYIIPASLRCIYHNI